MARRMIRDGTVRGLRELADLSLRDVCRDLGRTPGAVSRWECGLRKPSPGEAVRYVEIVTAVVDALGLAK